MTYSILGRDPETGELGVAVQSQAFNTGAAVPWARPGVGVIATQSFTDRRYGWWSDASTIDQANQALAGTVIGVVGSLTVLGIGVWLLTRKPV